MADEHETPNLRERGGEVGSARRKTSDRAFLEKPWGGGRSKQLSKASSSTELEKSTLFNLGRGVKKKE